MRQIFPFFKSIFFTTFSIHIQVQEGQVQKKITPWSQMFDLEQESKRSPCYTDLIIVASLIGKDFLYIKILPLDGSHKKVF